MSLIEKVDRYLELKRQIAELEAELALANAFFIDAARQELDSNGISPHTGQSHEWRATDGSLVRVNFPKDRVISSFQIDDDDRYFRLDKEAARIPMPAVNRLAESDFRKLFCTWFKPAKAFRELTVKLLKPGPAANVLAECTEPSSPRVSCAPSSSEQRL